MPRPDGRPARILLVEHIEADVLLTRHALREAQTRCRLSVARDAEDALRRLRREKPYARAAVPDLLLLELNLPRMSGVELLNTIRADRNLARIPVVVLTSSPVEIDLVKSYVSAGDAFIAKPIQPASLAELIAAMT